MTEPIRKQVAVPAVALTIAFILSGSTVVGQTKPSPSKTDPKPTLTTQGGSGVLAGPKVEQEAQSEKVPPMDQQARGRMQQGDMPFQQWMSALRGLELTEEQQTKVRAISQEFRKAQREYQDSHGEDAKELYRQAREAKESGTPPPKDLREKLQKIETNRPKPGPYQTRIWNELTAKQQDLMKTRLEDLRKEMEQRREKRQADGKGEGQADSKSPDDAMNNAPDNGAAAAGGEKARDGQTNERSQRRIKFLRSHQAGKHPDGQPTQDERQFHFDDQNEKEPPAN